MIPVSEQPEAAAPDSHSHDQHQPANGGANSHPAQSRPLEQPGASLSMPEAPKGSLGSAQAALEGPGGPGQQFAELPEHVQGQQLVPQPHPAPQAGAHESAHAAPPEGSYEALAAFSSPVGTELPGAGLHHDAQDQQPTHQPDASSPGDSAHAEVHSAEGDRSQVSSEAMLTCMANRCPVLATIAGHKHM